VNGRVLKIVYGKAILRGGAVVIVSGLVSQAPWQKSYLSISSTRISGIKARSWANARNSSGEKDAWAPSGEVYFPRAL